MGLRQNYASAGQTKGTEILNLVNDEHLIDLWNHTPTGAEPIGKDPSEQTKGTEILHLVNDEHLISWLHYWTTGAGPIGPDSNMAPV